MKRNERWGATVRPIVPDVFAGLKINNKNNRHGKMLAQAKRMHIVLAESIVQRNFEWIKLRSNARRTRNAECNVESSETR